MPVHNVQSNDDFKKHISSGKTVVVDFYATWCGPCKVIAPKLVEMSDRYPNVLFLKVDVDEMSDTAAENQIHAMPTFIIFKDGKQVEEIVGADAAKLEAKIKEHA